MVLCDDAMVAAVIAVGLVLLLNDDDFTVVELVAGATEYVSY